MKQKLILLLVLLWLLLLSLSWAQCPEDPVDLGYCDTLHAFPWSWTDTFYVHGSDTICVNEPGDVFPCLAYVSLLITHDSNTFLWESEQMWVQDSLVGFLIPLSWTHTNAARYCSASYYLNQDATNPYDPRLPTSLWRDIGGMENRFRFLNLYCYFPPCWNTALDISNDVPRHVHLSTFADNPRGLWWEGQGILFATLTFEVEDTMTVCIDTLFWPSGEPMGFLRLGATGFSRYCPRDNMPLCFRIFETGDFNANGIVDVGDQVYLYNYLFIGGPPPTPYEAGDLTEDGIVDVGDLTYMINYLFLSGPVPPVMVISPADDG